MEPIPRPAPPARLGVLLPPAIVAGSVFAGAGRREATLLLALGTLLVLAAVRLPAIRSLAAGAALLAAVAGQACLLPPGTGWHARSTPAVPLVRGVLLGSEERPGSVILVLSGGRRVRVPITGVPALDRWPGGCMPGCRIEVPLRDTPGSGSTPTAPCAASIRVLADPSLPARLRAVPGIARELFRRHAVERLLPAGAPSGPGSGLAIALVAGDRSYLPAATREDLRAAGVAHVAVVSGLHFGLLVGGGLVVLGGRLGRRHPARAVIAVVLAAGLFAVLPAAPPVLRAACAVLVAGSGALLGRRTDPLARVGAAGLALLLVEPSLAPGASFRLTVAATWAIAAAITGSDGGRGRGVRVALAPFLATWPLLVGLAGRVSPWAPLGNLVVAPLVPLVLASGWTAALLPSWLAGPVDLSARVAVVGGRALAAAAAVVADLPGSGAAVPSPLPGQVLLHEAALAGWLLLPGRRRGTRRLALAVLVLLLARDVGLAPPFPPGTRRPRPGIAILDVGQGQAVLAVGDGGGTVLVDTGDDRGREGTRALLRELARRGVRSLDLLCLTHGDRDHAGGAPLVLRAVGARAVLVPPGLLDAPRLLPCLRIATARGIPVFPAARGGELVRGGVRIRVLHPSPGCRQDGNETSLVLLLRAGGVTALVPGDAGLASEPDWRPAIGNRCVDLLVPAHHGARTGTGRRLLAAVRPRCAVVSAGRGNPHGHPHPETLRRLAAAGVRVLSTARSGSVVVSVAGGRLRVAPSFPARQPANPPRSPRPGD